MYAGVTDTRPCHTRPVTHDPVTDTRRWACPISSQVTDHWGELRNRTGEVHPVDPFHSLDILKNHFADRISIGGSHGRGNDLELSKHIATMTNKANSKLGFLCRNLKGCRDKLK